MEGKNKFLQTLRQSIEKGEEIAPFLCMGRPKKRVFEIVEEVVRTICQEFSVDTHSVFRLSDGGESLKISEIRDFFVLSFQKSRLSFQVFIIESFERATEEASNAALKFLEEPGKGNIFILSSESEAAILDTILSRVQNIYLGDAEIDESQIYIWKEIVSAYKEWKNFELIEKVFQQKLDRHQAILILQAIFSLCLDGKIVLSDISELESDMQGLMKNNLLPRYIVDKWILLISQ